MLNPKLFMRMAISEVGSSVSFFPYSFHFHIIFVCIVLLFFGFRFLKTKEPYQLIFALAVLFSLTLHISFANKTWLCIIGIVEGIILLCSLISYLLWKKRREKK